MKTYILNRQLKISSLIATALVVLAIFGWLTVIRGQDFPIAFEETTTELVVKIDFSAQDSLEINRDYIVSYIGPENISQLDSTCNELNWEDIKTSSKDIEIQNVEDKLRGQVSIALSPRLNNDHGFCLTVLDSQDNRWFNHYQLSQAGVAEDKATGEFDIKDDVPIAGTDIPKRIKANTVDSQTVKANSWQFAIVDDVIDCTQYSEDGDLVFEGFDDNSNSTSASLELSKDFANKTICLRAEDSQSGAYIYDTHTVGGILEVEPEDSERNWYVIGIVVILIVVILYFTFKSKQSPDDDQASDKPSDKDSRAKK